MNGNVTKEGITADLEAMKRLRVEFSLDGKAEERTVGENERLDIGASRGPEHRPLARSCPVRTGGR